MPHQPLDQIRWVRVALDVVALKQQLGRVIVVRRPVHHVALVGLGLLVGEAQSFCLLLVVIKLFGLAAFDAVYV